MWIAQNKYFKIKIVFARLDPFLLAFRLTASSRFQHLRHYRTKYCDYFSWNDIVRATHRSSYRTNCHPTDTMLHWSVHHDWASWKCPTCDLRHKHRATWQVSKLYKIGCCLNASFSIFFYILGRWSFRTKALFISLATKPTQLEIMINADQCKWLLTIADNFSVCWRIWPMQPDDL